jgi:tetratricopeptide (TPR) repeat protein
LNCIALIWWIFLVGVPQEAILLEPLQKTASEPCLALVNHLQSFSLIDALVDRARLRLLSNDFNAARADVDAALALDPTNPALYVLRGQAFLALYEWDLSLSDYNTAIQLDANYADAYFFRGVLRYSILQTGFSTHEDALADFEQYLRLAPDGPHAQSAKHYADSIRQTFEALEERP